MWLAHVSDGVQGLELVPAAGLAVAYGTAHVALGKTDLKRLRNKEAARRSRAKKAAARAAAKEQAAAAAALELQRPILDKRSEIAALTRRKEELLALLRGMRHTAAT